MMFKKMFVLLVLMTSVYGADASPNDLDNDLVPNNKDKCPNTPEGVFVTRDGCTKQIKKTVHFKHASSKLNQKDKIVLILVSELISGTPGYKIDIVGHTDSIADARTNMILSKKRANTVKKFLVNSQISENIMSTSWYGETRPIATNITKEGRSKNRRVDIILK